MTEQEAIELHIQENLHRISVIEQFLSTSPDADDKECQKKYFCANKGKWVIAGNSEVSFYWHNQGMQGGKEQQNQEKANYLYGN